MDAEATTELLSFAHHLADEAGPMVLRYFRRPLTVEEKPNRTPVTEADKAVESRLRTLISARYPHHGIIGEEYGSSGGDREFVWVIDPIDGTRAFICGLPVFGTLLALMRDEIPVLGIIDQAHTRERWSGGLGVPARLNGKAARTSACERLAAARVVASSHDYFVGDDLNALYRLVAATSVVRYGASCYGYGLLASGFVDVLIDADLNEHDYLAQVAVIEAAGGTVTDWAGNSLRLHGGASRVIASCSAALHEQALRHLHP